MTNMFPYFVPLMGYKLAWCDLGICSFNVIKMFVFFHRLVIKKNISRENEDTHHFSLVFAT